MEKSKKQRRCTRSHVGFSLLCSPASLSFSNQGASRSLVRKQSAFTETKRHLSNPMRFLQQCVSLCEAWSRYAWLAGWLALICIYMYMYEQPIVAYPYLSLLSSTPTPTLKPHLNLSTTTTHPPIYPPPISPHLYPPLPPQKKKERNGLRPLPPPPLSKPLPLQRSTLPALFFAEKARVRVRVRGEDAGGGGAASGAVPGRGGEEAGVSEAV